MVYCNIRTKFAATYGALINITVVTIFFLHIKFVNVATFFITKLATGSGKVWGKGKLAMVWFSFGSVLLALNLNMNLMFRFSPMPNLNLISDNSEP